MPNKVLRIVLVFVLIGLTKASWGVATNPTPPDYAIEVGLDITLEWTGSEQAISYDVYFGQDWEMLDPLGNVLLESYPLDPLLPDSIYYWQIDEHLPGFVVETGNIWTFATVPEPVTLSLLALGGLALFRKRKH